MLILRDLAGGELLLVVSGPSSSSMTSRSRSFNLSRFSRSSSMRFYDAIPASIPESILRALSKIIDCSHCLMAISTPLKSFKLQATKERSIRPSRFILLNKLNLDYELFLSANMVGLASSSSLSDSIMLAIIFLCISAFYCWLFLDPI